MATDTGIITVYDMQNGGKPLTTHRIDARELLAHPSKRWSATPYVEIKGELAEGGGGKGTQIDGQGLDPIRGDSGEVMRLKEMSFKALQAMAGKAGIADYQKMSKAELVAALDAK